MIAAEEQFKMPEPGYASDPPGCLPVLIGLILIVIVALIIKSCL